MTRNDLHDPTEPIAVLIPAYNEESRIEPVIELALSFLPVMVIDDGSTDGTATVASKAGAVVIEQKPNQGKGAALRLGFRRALEESLDAVITLDADGQHDPLEIPSFLAAFKSQQAELIVGQRNFKDMPPIRRLANTLGEKTFSWAVGHRVFDNQSGYRLIGRRLMMDLLDSEESGFEFELDMIVQAVRSEYAIEWVPIRTIYAGETSHIDPIHHLSNFLRVAWNTRRSSKSRPS